MTEWMQKKLSRKIPPFPILETPVFSFISEEFSHRLLIDFNVWSVRVEGRRWKSMTEVKPIFGGWLARLRLDGTRTFLRWRKRKIEGCFLAQLLLLTFFLSSCSAAVGAALPLVRFGETHFFQMVADNTRSNEWPFPESLFLNQFPRVIFFRHL